MIEHITAHEEPGSGVLTLLAYIDELEREFAVVLEATRP
ncbi:MAG: hypothetical protein RLZZ217_2150 [Planctomycetota bacterium]|jgi:hypothetical protein